MTTSEAIDLIISIKEYMDNRADISTNDPSCPNVEMSFSKQLDELLKKMEEQQIIEIVPIGTKVRVTKKTIFICCDIGDVLTIIFYDPKDPILPYKCEKENGLKQWLPRDVFEPV